MADGEETHLLSSSYRISCAWWGFVMKGSGFVWAGQAQRPSSLLALIINIIKETNNFTLEAGRQLVLSMWGSLSLCEIAWENKNVILCQTIQFSSVTQSCLTLCNPMDCSTPGFPVHHQLLELAQTHVHQVSDAIQPFPPLSSPSPPTFNLSQHQDLF